MRNIIRKFVKNEDGVTLIEYGLIAALIAVVLAASLTTLTGELQTTFTNTGGALTP